MDIYVCYERKIECSCGLRRYPLYSRAASQKTCPWRLVHWLELASDGRKISVTIATQLYRENRAVYPTAAAMQLQRIINDKLWSD